MNELIEQATEYGRQAILNGRSSVPVQDRDLMRLITENSVGRPFGWTARVFDAWSNSYHAQILGGNV